MKVLFLTRYDRLGSSSRLRGLQFLPCFEQGGIQYEVRPFISDEMLHAKYVSGSYGIFALALAYLDRFKALLSIRNFDLVWIEKESLPWLPAFIERFFLRKVRYVLDYDDAQFHNYDLHPVFIIRKLLGTKIQQLVARARLVVVGNPYLRDWVLSHGAINVEAIPTVIDLTRYCFTSEKSFSSQFPTVVWIGSPSTVRYLNEIAPALVSLSKSYKFKLRVIGAKINIAGVEIEALDWNEATEVADIAKCDVGVMPLQDSPWERGKCGYKLIQYMACGLPVIASPVGVNTQIVKDGLNGYLATNTDEWLARLSQLLANIELRKQFGQAGRQMVESEYCVQKVGPRLAQLLTAAGASH